MSHTGALLRKARTDAGLSMRALAETARVSASTVARIESGTMDPTVSMLERLLASAGLRMHVIAEATTEPQLASLVDAWQPSDDGDVIDWTRLRAFLDHLHLHPEMTEAALTRMPAPSGSGLLDNLLAGVAEVEADRLGLERPNWTVHVPALVEPWTSPGTPRMQREAQSATPPALLTRGVIVSESSLWRDRSHAA